MDRLGQIFGKTLSLIAPAALVALESAISEGIAIPRNWTPVRTGNIFGRSARIQPSSDLSFPAGFASAGLRSAAFVPAADIPANLGRLRELVRNHTPMLVYCLTDDSNTGLPAIDTLKSTGVFILSASTVQEAVDLAAPAHAIAESALVPGIIMLHLPSENTREQEILFPEAQYLNSLLGDPDDSIPAPTPAQQMVFGKNRRRIPNWFHFDYPTITGAGKNGQDLALELAAQAQYFVHDIPKALQGETHAPALEGYKTTDADYILLTWGPVYAAAKAAADQMRSTDKARVGCVQLHQIFPLPVSELVQLFSGKKAITWLESASCLSTGSAFSSEAMESVVSACGKKAPEVYRGTYGYHPDVDSIVAVFSNMMPKGAQKTGYYLGLDFTRSKSEFPQHEILLQTIQRDFPQAGEWTLPSDVDVPASAQHPIAATRLPWMVRRQHDLGPAYSRITRFYHNTGALYAAGADSELVADPFQAISSIPAGSAGLMGRPEKRDSLPVFLPELCTGCGDCFVHCPHAALPPLALNIEQLLRGAMRIAGNKGAPLTQLTPLLKNLGKTAGQVIREKEGPVRRFSDFLPETFDRLAAQMQLDETKRTKLQQEINTVLEIMAPLPFAVTDTFYSLPEQIEKGKGELFSLALDNQACTGCGICAHICASEALQMAPETDQIIGEANAALEVWEQLPDTDPDTISRLHRDPDYDSFAAILLSRFNYLSLSGPGSDTAAPGKTLLHLLTAMTESLVQPKTAAWFKEIEKLIADLAENIRKNLSEALPSEDSLGLIGAITEAGGRKLPLDEIIGKLSSLEHLKLVDTAALQRKIKLVNDLKDLLWVLREGPSGGSRSRYGLAFLGQQPEYAGHYPFHPFHAPALVAPAGSPDLGLGLFEAYLRHTLDNLRLIRRAKLEIRNQYRPEFHAAAIAELDWTQLEPEEKAVIPPLLLVCDRHQLPEKFTDRLIHLLAQDKPLKFVVLDNAIPQPGEPPASGFIFRNMLLQSAQSTRNAHVFTGSLGDRKALFHGLLRGLGAPGPALFLLHSPTPAQHIVPAYQGLRLPELALHTRAFPVYYFNPEKAGALLATGISLEGNPAERENWAMTPWRFQDGQEEKEGAVTLTYADWLFSLNDWQDEFTEVQESTGIGVAEFLDLPAAARDGKTAVVFRLGNNGELKRYQVSERVLESTSAALSAWNALRETAGTLSAHPQKLWEEAEKSLSAKYEQQIQEMKAAYEDQLKSQEQQVRLKIKEQLREKLVRLSVARMEQAELNRKDN